MFDTSGNRLCAAGSVDRNHFHNVGALPCCPYTTDIQWRVPLIPSGTRNIHRACGDNESMNRSFFISLRSSWLLISVFSVAAAVTGYSRTPVEPINKNGESLALKGYDPVAYFTAGKPVKGSPQFLYEWMNVRWIF